MRSILRWMTAKSWPTHRANHFENGIRSVDGKSYFYKKQTFFERALEKLTWFTNLAESLRVSDRLALSVYFDYRYRIDCRNDTRYEANSSYGVVNVN